MTLASWFSSLKPSRRRQAQNGGRRNRSHVFDRSAFLEALEDRLVLSSVSFSAGSETVNESAGTFSIPVTLSGSRTPTVSTFASGFDSPYGLAFDSAGNLYVANYNNNTVSQVTPAGAVSTFASGFNLPDGLAFDSAGNLYVANWTGGTVSEVTPAGLVSTFASGFDDPDRPGLRLRRQPLRRQPLRHGEQGDARGGGQHLRLRVRRSRRLGLRLGRQPLRRQLRHLSSRSTTR